jgi:hypothetical protein
MGYSRLYCLKIKFDHRLHLYVGAVIVYQLGLPFPFSLQLQLWRLRIFALFCGLHVNHVTERSESSAVFFALKTFVRKVVSAANYTASS